MPAFSLDIADATELAELLRFLNDWLASDPDQLDASLRRFVDHPAYDIRALRADLDRFAFPPRRRRRKPAQPAAIADTQPRPGLRSIGEANRPDHTHNRRASNPGLYFFLIGCSEVGEGRAALCRNSLQVEHVTHGLLEALEFVA